MNSIFFSLEKQTKPKPSQIKPTDQIWWEPIFKGTFFMVKKLDRKINKFKKILKKF